MSTRPDTAREFWTDGFPPPARDSRSAFFRTLAHVYLAGVSAMERLLRTLRKPADLPTGRQSGLRVLAIGPFFSENWVAAHLEALARCDLVERVSVLTPGPFRDIKDLDYVAFPPGLAQRYGDGGARMITALRTVRRERPDLIIGYHLPWNGLMSLLLARAFGSRVLYFSVGGPAEFLGGGCYSEHALFRRIGGESKALERRFVRLIGRFDGVLTMGTRSRELFKSLELGIPIHPVSVGVNAEKFLRRDALACPNSSGGDCYDLVTVGRLAHIKRVDLLIRAVAGLPAGLRPTVAVVGDGSEAEGLKALASDLGIDEQVHFLGWREDVEQILRRSRCFVMSSASEGLPLALIEAMLTGLPAVVPDVGDIPDLVEPGVSGFLFEPGNLAGLQRALEGILDDETRHETMSREARHHAERFTVDARAADWHGLLAGLATAGAGPEDSSGTE
jgi:glycosyltransferase involved in cell wall biosynthesis